MAAEPHPADLVARHEGAHTCSIGKAHGDIRALAAALERMMEEDNVNAAAAARAFGERAVLAERERDRLRDAIKDAHAWYADCRNEAKVLRREGNPGTAVLLDNVADSLSRALAAVDEGDAMTDALKAAAEALRSPIPRSHELAAAVVRAYLDNLDPAEVTDAFWQLSGLNLTTYDIDAVLAAIRPQVTS